MKLLGKIIAGLLALVVLAFVGAGIWLYVSPPELIRVASAYSAKMVCSNVHLARRDAGQVLADDVQAPGHPILKYVKIRQEGDTVSASLLGIFGEEYAIYRPGVGCANVPDHNLEAARKTGLAAEPDIGKPSEFEWPLGDTVAVAQHPPISALLADDALAGPGMRAIVVVKDGRIIAERYGAGFSAETPLLGWSMTKTVTGALVGIRIGEGKLAYDQDKLFPGWSDGRAAIKVEDLLSMQSGLNLEETYGDVNDVTRMLFLEPDQANFVAAHGLEAPPATKFEYTTGSAVLLTRLWMETFADRAEALAWPRKVLFGPLGMRSAVMETDETGVFSGGSLMYATGRDWARFGLLLLNKGDWNGVQVLPEEFATRVSTGTPVSNGDYTGGLAWKLGPQDLKNDQFKLPGDTFWALGHDGQSIAIIPSAGLVIVRMGLTPSKLDYRPQVLVEKIIETLQTSPIENPSDTPAQPATSDPDVQPE